MAAGLVLMGCVSRKPHYDSVDDYPVKAGSSREMSYSSSETNFTLWSPNADSVMVYLYEAGEGGEPVKSQHMTRRVDGCFETSVLGDWKGYFYTFRVWDSSSKWELHETPGIFAVAVGVNGKRGAIIDMKETNPQGWCKDKRPEMNNFADAIVYEMHHRDFSIHPSSGITNRGKFIALTEEVRIRPKGKKPALNTLRN